MKSFRKATKKITINDFTFLCVINEIPSNDSVSFKVYSSKTSFFEVHFTWQGTWYFNLHSPKNCAILINYAIENGWDFRQDKKTMEIDEGDFLIDKLGLSV